MIGNHIDGEFTASARTLANACVDVEAPREEP